MLITKTLIIMENFIKVKKKRIERFWIQDEIVHVMENVPKANKRKMCSKTKGNFFWDIFWTQFKIWTSLKSPKHVSSGRFKAIYSLKYILCLLDGK